MSGFSARATQTWVRDDLLDDRSLQNSGNHGDPPGS